MQNTLIENEKKDTFWKSLLVLALPLLVQNLIDSCVGMADTVMLGYVSQTSLSASSLANNVQFIVGMFLYGMCSGSSVLIAQYWGRGDMDTIERTIGITLRFTLIVGILFSLTAALIPTRVMTLYTNDPALIDVGAKYLRIISVTYLVNAFTQVYISSQRAMERALFGTVVNTVELVLNVCLNACFIFGFGPFPELGLTGVALATVIARVVGLVICLGDALRKDMKVRVRIPYLFARKKELFRDYMHYTLPALGEDFCWGLGFSMYSVILGHLGSDIVAANSYANVARSLSTVVCFAIANASAVIMGKVLGENKLDLGRKYGFRFLVLSFVTGILGGLAILSAVPLIMRYVNTTDATAAAKDFLQFMLYVSSVNVIGQSVNTMTMAGIFRAGGDTRYGLICDAIIMWGYGVAVGLLLAFVFKVPAKIVYLYLFMDETVKIPINCWRYSKKVWVKNITRDMSKAE